MKEVQENQFEIENLKEYLDNSFIQDNIEVTDALVNQTLLAIKTGEKPKLSNLHSKKRNFKVWNKYTKILAGSAAVIILFFLARNVFDEEFNLDKSFQTRINNNTSGSVSQETDQGTPDEKDNISRLNEKIDEEQEAILGSSPKSEAFSQTDKNEELTKGTVEEKMAEDNQISDKVFSDIYFLSIEDIETIYVTIDSMKHQINKFEKIKEYLNLLNQYKLTEVESVSKELPQSFSYQMDFQLKNQNSVMISIYFGKQKIFIENKETQEIKVYITNNYKKLKNALKF